MDHHKRIQRYKFNNNELNNELTNTLIKGKFIQTMDVENVIRSVDRGLFFNNDEKYHSVKDSPWRSDNNIQLVAQYIYATVLECLDLKPGNKFLNIGSGNGYLSTLAGLLLGANGVNHGIEIHQLLIDCAHQNFKKFKLNSAAIDYYYFREPVIIQGNVCEMSTMGFYDRVYCGADVPVEMAHFMMTLIKIGGILVMPLEGILVRITRKDEFTFKTDEVFYGVSFKALVIPEKKCVLRKIEFPPAEPMTLKELCRFEIRSSLREILINKTPSLSIRTVCTSNNFVVPKNLNLNIPWFELYRTEPGRFGNTSDLDDFYVINEYIPRPDIVYYGNHDDDDNKLEKVFNDGDDSNDFSTACDHKRFTKLYNFGRYLFKILRLKNKQTNLKEQNRNTAVSFDESTRRMSQEAGCSLENKTLSGTVTEAKEIDSKKKTNSKAAQ